MPVEKPIVKSEETDGEFDGDKVTLNDIGKFFLLHHTHPGIRRCKYFVTAWLQEREGTEEHQRITLQLRQVDVKKAPNVAASKRNKYPARHVTLADLAERLEELLAHERLPGNGPVGWCVEAHYGYDGRREQQFGLQQGQTLVIHSATNYISRTRIKIAAS